MDVKLRPPIVFVLEQMPFDFTPAEAFGAVRFLETRKISPAIPTHTNSWNNEVADSIRRQLEDYVPGHDFIIPTGSPMKLMIAGAVLSQMVGPAHKILGWDARSARYIEYPLPL